MKKIIVIFKTHLDVGFTDSAKNITENYMTNYLPNAMRVAKQMRGEKEGFIWTVGSWLIEKFLEESEDRELLEDAIRHGEVRWHGIPFTTHTELMDSDLFQYGLNISQKLDSRFGMQTIAAKMTDVPGHTKAMIPYLYRAGIRFLHIGVNPASTRPSVPNLFRWRADTGEELLVMYNNDYGQLTEIGKSGTAVYFAHTGDNRGPQSAEAIRKIYQKLHETYPEAELCAGTLEDVAEIALQEENLPVITDEIGDSWIHGAGTDPGKMSQFRALLRLKEKFPMSEMEKIYKEILLVPEHTWGLDEKSYLGEVRDGELYGEYRFFEKKEFEEARKTEKFQKMEQSWQEQRGYIQNAVNALDGEAKKLAETAVSQYRRDRKDTKGWQKAALSENLEINGYHMKINESGAISRLEKDGVVLADEQHLLGQFLYEVFSQKEYDRFRGQYVVSEEQWAYEDFGKIGVSEAVSEQKQFLPRVKEMFRKENEVVVKMYLPKEAVDCYGGMEELEMCMEFREKEILFDFAWFGKEASRIPEAAWLQFAPNDRIVSIEKLGKQINPSKVVEDGNRHMHAVGAGVKMQRTELITYDAPLIALGAPWMLNFTNEEPQLENGVWANLINNVWGTNFTMWYGEDARFRFMVRI